MDHAALTHLRYMDVVADLPDVPAESHNIPPALSCQCARERFNWWMMSSEEAGIDRACIWWVRVG